MKKYEEVFKDEVGTMTGVKAKVILKEGATPKYFKPRQMAYALKPKVEMEIDRLVQTGIISPVSYSDWGTPIVPVAKKDG